MSKATTQHQCDICASPQTFEILISHHDNNYFVDKIIYKLIRCTNCSVATISNKPTQQQMGKYYQKNYYSYDTTSSIFFRMKHAWSKFAGNLNNTALANRLLFGGLYILPTRKRAKALDVGCGDGSALQSLGELGYADLTGTEISKDVCKKLEEKGITAYCGSDITTLKLKTNEYDLVRMSHVLEHVYNPRETLHFLRKTIAPGGHLLIGVPNFGSPAAKLFGRYFCALQMPTHLHHFNKKNLKKLLKDEGYVVNRMKTTGFSGVSYSIIVLIKDKWGKQKIPIIVSTLVIIALVPIEIILNLFGKGYIINVHAVKR